MGDIRVSYVMATKNRADTLCDALERLEGLAGPDDEVIVMDGLSEDHTPEVIDEFFQRGVIAQFASEADKNAADATNKGIALAQGEYVRPISDDDITLPEGMAQAIQIMNDNPEVDVMLCGGTKVSKSRETTICLPVGVDYGSHSSKPMDYGGCGAGIIARRRVFEKIKFSTRIRACDVMFLADAIKEGFTVKFCRVNLYVHRVFSRTAGENDMPEGFSNIREKHGDFVRPKTGGVFKGTPAWDGAFA